MALRSLVSGVTANERVNGDQEKQVGEDIMKSMIGQNVHIYSFQKKESFH